MHDSDWFILSLTKINLLLFYTSGPGLYFPQIILGKTYLVNDNATKRNVWTRKKIPIFRLNIQVINETFRLKIAFTPSLGTKKANISAHNKSLNLFSNNPEFCAGIFFALFQLSWLKAGKQA